ncbi:MAG: metal-dependent hydrolase [Gammaproteobacteria bacterium]|nr:metal-dependent hydrolase [Gammaproteobacteria bacterium]
MANFKTHVLVAAAVSGSATVVALSSGLLSAQVLPAYFLLGTMAGLLPDIDSDNSVPIRLFFNLMAVSAAFATLFSVVDRYSIVELLLLWGGVYFLVRYTVFELFIRLTVHRGVFHSVLAACFFALLFTCVADYWLHRSEVESWLAGAFVFMGYLVHLSLDELYSVDLTNIRLKRSFGTALKLVSLKYIKETVVLFLLTLMLFSAAPSGDFFLQTTWNGELYQSIVNKLWPDGRWFSGLWPTHS